MNLKYITRVMGGASFSKMNEKIDFIHKKSGKNKAVLFFDMLGCAVKYGAGYNDYAIFEFYNMNAKQRKTYLTRMKNKKLVMALNDDKYARIFDEKNLFNAKFEKFMKRECLDMEKVDFEQFEKFVSKNPTFIAKPSIGECGKGIEKIDTTKFENTKAVWDYMKDKNNGFGVAEELIIQHPQAAKIYPCAINCLRVVTLVSNGEPHILYAVFKTGNNGKFVDNLENGGLACHFDLDKGEVVGPGHTNQLETFDKHPYTGIEFRGYKLPFMDEVKQLVKEAAMVCPEFRYVGWDVCLSEKGPAIVEGNDYPAYDFPQLPDADREKIGLIASFEKYGVKVKR